MTKTIITAFLVLGIVGLNAQNVVINEAYGITRLMERYVELNRAQDRIEGWRIQVLATTDRSKLERAKQNFQAKYPNIPVNWVHASPYYKLRAGAFETKLDATRLLQRLKRDFPSAYPARDRGINPLEIINKNY